MMVDIISCAISKKPCDIPKGKKMIGNPDNTSKRVPVALCLDTSGSMSPHIDDLNNAVGMFYKQCQSDAKASQSVEVVAIEFGHNGVNIASPFNEIGLAQIPHFSADNGTPMGAGVTLALNELETRKTWYQNEGIDYYQPILVLMTDGQSGDDITHASARATDLVKNKRLIVIPLAFGSADVRTLESFGSKHIKITQNFSFLEFFQWLSASASAQARGQDIDLSDFF